MLETPFSVPFLMYTSHASGVSKHTFCVTDPVVTPLAVQSSLPGEAKWGQGACDDRVKMWWQAGTQAPPKEGSEDATKGGARGVAHDLHQVDTGNMREPQPYQPA